VTRPIVFMPWAQYAFVGFKAEDTFDVRAVDVGGDPYRYATELSELWAIGRTFAIVEHDIEITNEQLAQLFECDYPWCAHGYAYPDRAAPVYGLGAVKFAGPLLRFTGNVGRDLPRLRWGQIDDYLYRVLQRRGFAQHRHGIVEHHRRPVSRPIAFAPGWEPNIVQFGGA
jgi:hypothetical protein